MLLCLLPLLPAATTSLPPAFTSGPVHWADPADPVLAASIPPGWRLAPAGPCRDSLPSWPPGLLASCSALANASKCEQLPRLMLSECRATCAEHYRGLAARDLPDPVEEHGGLGEDLVDVFGFRLPLCSLADGFESNQRDTFLRFHSEMQRQKPYVPQLTEEGFKLTRIPTELFKAILQARDEALAAGNVTDEQADAGVINVQAVLDSEAEQQSLLVAVRRTRMIALQDRVKEEMFMALGPLAEDWSGLKLQPTSVYGIRRYRNRSSLISHMDKPWSHVVSAILNIGQEVEEDWPLFIKDHDDRTHVVVLRPGDMVWYESARLAHSRQWPMKGSHYDNIFLHYKPRRAWYEAEGKTMGAVMPITREFVLHHQKVLEPTDWSDAWLQFMDYKSNEQLEAGQAQYRLGLDPYGERGQGEAAFQHIR